MAQITHSCTKIKVLLARLDVKIFFNFCFPSYIGALTNSSIHVALNGENRVHLHGIQAAREKLTVMEESRVLPEILEFSSHVLASEYFSLHSGQSGLTILAGCWTDWLQLLLAKRTALSRLIFASE